MGNRAVVAAIAAVTVGLVCASVTLTARSAVAARAARPVVERLARGDITPTMRTKLRRLALRTARADRDPHPTSARAYLTTYGTAMRVFGWGGGHRKQHVYVIILRGRFVDYGATGPPRAAPPRGTMVFLVWHPRRGVTDYGIGKTVDTHLLGRGVSLL
jgi:hypothetical protein